MEEYDPWKQGDAYAAFLVNTLKPYVDARYRTQRDAAHTGIMGSSMGGLISFYAALRYPAVFGRAAAFSSSFCSAGPGVSAFARRAAPRVRLYFAAGGMETKDGSQVRDPLEMVDTLVAAGWRRDVNVRSVVAADGQHSEWFWRREFPAAYLWLFGRR
jgi:metallo-beta-lactamase class B